VVSNLLNNAAKYTGRSGVIRIKVERQNGQVSLSVKDSGIGIAPEHLPRLFEMFTQLPGTADRSGSGLGIGLALVRALVEMHGGKVEARSSGLAMGSEFIVTLPAASAPTAMPAQGSPETIATSTPRLRILIADDVADSAHTLALGIETFGHEVRTAADGVEALEVALDFQPDLAILDIGMPRLDGYEVARRIRASPLGREVVLVALTGWGQREDVEEATRAGFDRHMTKPADFAALRDLIRDVGSRRSGEHR
jgi:CheY-like chemotaxis protein